MKTGLFFGSFNPIHIGHLIIADTLAQITSLDEVWFIVSPYNPLKNPKSLIHEFDRYDMVELAIDNNDRLKASDIEFHLPKPSYTIDTLVYLKERNPSKDFKLLIGEDNLYSFSKWKNYKSILDFYGLIVYPRPNFKKEGPPMSHPNIEYVEAPLIEISATYIRDRIKKGLSIKYLVPEKVEEYIEKKKLYC